MDNIKLAALITACTGAIAISLVAAECSDGRSDANPCTKRFSSRVSQWGEVQLNPLFHQGWYLNQFRCTKATFDVIVQMIRWEWCRFTQLPGKNSYFSIKDRVALTLHYVTHAGSIIESGKVFGMSKSSAVRFIWEVCLMNLFKKGC
jgi:hypothetical protein